MATKIPSIKGDKVLVDLDSVAPKSGTHADVSARFDVQSLLGEGGMGSVFVAQDRGLGRVVALKRLRDGLENDAGVMRRFMLEAQIGAQLEHPNIVPLYSYEHSDDGSPAITMQLLEGTTMAAYVEKATAAPKEQRSMKGEYSLKERIGRLLGVCEATDFAHERGVIHRDLKPDNVMLGHYREVYVMDWGLARVVGSPVDMATEDASAGADNPEVTRAREALGHLATMVETSEPQAALGHLQTVAIDSSTGPKMSSTATRQGAVMGTPQYMPPEQALGLIDQVGPAADQYALGVMLQELATLKPARSHDSAMEALVAAMKNELAAPIDIDDQHLHPALTAIITRATQKEITARYPSVRALADDLRRFIRDEPVSVFAEGMGRQLVRAAARRPMLTMALFSALGLLASVAVIGVVVRDAQNTARSAREMENTQRALIAVSGRSQEIDVVLSDLAAGVEAIGAATVELLDRKPSDFERAVRPLPPLMPFEPSGWAPVSFEASVIVWPGKSTETQYPDNAARLTRLERWLRACVVDALPPAEKNTPRAAQNAALVAGKSALLRGFVGLEDGTFSQYPARVVTADPRGRPWYRMAAQELGLHWTRPMADASKRTLRIAAVLGLRDEGHLLGVAGCDLRVSELAKKLPLDLPGFQRAYLVTEDGRIAISDTLEARILKDLKDQDEDLQLPLVEDRDLAARIAGPERGGYVVAGERLLVFSKLISPPWTYVAELEKSRYLEH